LFVQTPLVAQCHVRRRPAGFGGDASLSSGSQFLTKSIQVSLAVRQLLAQLLFQPAVRLAAVRMAVAGFEQPANQETDTGSQEKPEQDVEGGVHADG
jgi:hypothetical protein